MSTDAVRKLLGRLAAQAGLDIKVHCHMMRHACGYYLVNQGYNTREIQDFLGHRDIKHTEKYTKLNARRFLNFDWVICNDLCVERPQDIAGLLAIP
ncbi:tyrosine-type recombinase/integrase [Nostoc sp. KVJ3]|uniref:tyrosine-type recombinase/integrase n=1 Tax=Nostoc sp. KVJ3 TaxID=457945 RepID=UPI002AA2B64E|nr:tyrosine-type recombinase/integrase [Nostoc sp. KVJ3]